MTRRGTLFLYPKRRNGNKQRWNCNNQKQNANVQNV
jgi:hypothetical protein